MVFPTIVFRKKGNVNMGVFKKIVYGFVLAMLFSEISLAAAITIDVSDSLLPNIQTVADKEHLTVQEYIQKIVTVAARAWKMEQETAQKMALKNMLDKLSPASQAELISALNAKAQAEGVK